MENIQTKRLFDEILTFLTEENAAIAGSLDGIKVVDILAMLFISITSFTIQLENDEYVGNSIEEKFFNVLGLEIMDLFIPICTSCPYLN